VSATRSPACGPPTHKEESRAPRPAFLVRLRMRVLLQDQFLSGP